MRERLRKVAGSVVFLSCLITTVVYGNYVVYDDTIFDDEISPSSYDSSQYKITFTSSEPGDDDSYSIYVDAGYDLSLKDAPYVNDGSTSYRWTAADGTDLANFDDGVSSDMTFSASVITEASTSDLSHSENLDETLTQDDQVPDVVDIELSDLAYDQDITTTVSIGYVVGGMINDTWDYDEQSNYSPSLSASGTTGYASYSRSQCGFKIADSEYNGDDTYNYNGDSTIALADVEGEPTDYKPFEGTSTIGDSYNTNTPYNSTYQNAVTNYPVARYTLANDVILNGATFTLAAHNGYYGNDFGWSQIQFNNYIVGAYYEIDLCGHDLYLTDGAALYAYGSITDSVGGGRVIVDDGSTLQGLFTLEDCYHETDVGIFGSNIPLLRMYRMPYLNCDILIRNGGYLEGYMMKDSGGDGSNGFDATVSLIGPEDSGSLIEMRGTDGSILRSVYYDDDIRYSDVSDKTERSYMIRNNLLNQRIRYTAYDCDLSFEEYQITIEYEFVLISGIWELHYSATVDSRRSQFFVPPYFEFYLEHSCFTLDQHLIFLPGSHLYVDDDSEIIFTTSDDEYERAGGLTFSPYLFDNYSTVRLNQLRGNNNDSTTVYMFYSTSTSNQVYSFWSYLNENKPAHADIYGTMTFEENDTDYPYVLSGNINFYDETGLTNYFASDNYDSNQTAIYPVYPHTDGNIVDKFADILNGEGDYAVMDFFTYPLISQGKVINLNDESLREEATYDAQEGLIVTEDGEYYAFIFDSYDAITDYYRDDMLPGSYVKVSYDESDHHITYDGQEYICFQGTYVPAESVSSTGATGVNLERFVGYGGDRETIIDDASSCTMTYDQTIERWCISSVD